MHEAMFYPAGSARCLLVQLDFGAEDVRVLNANNEVLHILPLSQLRPAPKLAATCREVMLPNVGLLSFKPTPELDSLLYSSDKSQWAHMLENSYQGIAISLLLVPLCLFIIFKYIIPHAAERFAEVVPYSAINLASTHTLKALDNSMLQPSELTLSEQQTILSNWQLTLSQLALDRSYYTLIFRKSDSLGANAFALPNGTIVVTDQFIKLIESRQDLLQAILLHEIGHVEHHHSMRLISQSLFSSLVIDYFFADVSGLIDAFAGISTTLVQNQFSSELEWEADNFALKQMKISGLDTENFALVLEKLMKTIPEESNIDSWLQTHPLLRKRIANARAAQH
ncbi:M48 family metallopeptidase [Paraglaciecola sp. 20A4]|uniref:M48 family metallopeptidase n=1 Tax=Paraglaciecola sp. 20A4 TaxID=2687288 RepID=UPI00140AE909|nr:M48 family metallopeptidase [Paraglaciecola sp. 20A4]